MLSLVDIGRKVVDARKKMGLTQVDLAKLAGVSRPTMDLLENGRAREVGYSKLVRILTAVGLELRLESISPERPTLDDLLLEDCNND